MVRSFVCALILIPAIVAHAAPIPHSQHTVSAKQTLAITVLAEDDACAWNRCLRDWRAMSWVLAKRWRMRVRTRKKETFEDTAKLFSSVWKVSSKRARELRALRFGEPSRGRWGSRWSMAQEFVNRWFEGRVPDPCPRALNWGGKMDTPQGSWEPIKCGDTRNIFWAITNND